MQIYPSFPTCRTDTPKRRAEKLIYETLQACELDGQALYEVKPILQVPQLDFAVWIAGVGVFGIQVKGGRYTIVDGEWYLITDRGRRLKESPVPATWDAAMAIRDVVQEQLRQGSSSSRSSPCPTWSRMPRSRPSPGPVTSRSTEALRGSWTTW